MAFVVDSSQWEFDGLDAQTITEYIDSFTQSLGRARSRGEIVWIGEDLQSKHVLEELDIWSLREAGFLIDHDLWQEFAAEIGRLNQYIDLPDWPAGFMDDASISIEGKSKVENFDVAWVHHHVRNGQAMGCIGLTEMGSRETSSSFGTCEVHWVVDAASHRQFWRSAIDLEGPSPAAFKRIAPHAYPNLYFCPGVLNDAETLKGGFHANLGLLRQYLDAFDDHGSWAFTAPPPALSPSEAQGTGPEAPSNQIIERRFMGLGLTVAPEKPNVYLQRNSRLAREVTVNGATLYCEWHGKLQLHQNRIHIHSPVPQSGNLLVIARIAVHLPLPGD